MSIRKLLTAPVLLATSFFTSCNVVLPVPSMPETAYPRLAAVLTEGVEIQGDGWQIKSGDPVAAPFRNEHVGGGMSPEKLLDESAAAVAKGAKFCRVKVPGRDKPLYGVLALNPVYKTSLESSPKRVYRIVVKQNRVQSALGGQVSLLYQPYNFKMKIRQKNASGDHYYRDHKAWHMSWVLWISDAPFPGQES